MNYTEVQIRQADAALKLLHDRRGIVDSHELYQVMGHPNAEYMRMVISEVLGLAVKRGSGYVITEEGEKAYRMGFRKYLKEKEHKQRLQDLSVKIGVIGGVIGSIGGILGVLSFIATCSGR